MSSFDVGAEFPVWGQRGSRQRLRVLAIESDRVEVRRYWCRKRRWNTASEYLHVDQFITAMIEGSAPVDDPRAKHLAWMLTRLPDDPVSSPPIAVLER